MLQTSVTPLGWIAFAYQLVSRLAYVLYVGRVLKRQDHTGYFTQRSGGDAAFRRFRWTASVLMSNDGVSLIVLCLVTRQTIGPPLSSEWVIAAGILLVALGIVTKLWAAATLGADAYYWRNFFSPREGVPTTAGPYRFLRNPMYTVGYLHIYGLALVTGSRFGLLAALFDQAAILAFYRWIEKPHFERYMRAPPRSRAGLLDSDAAAAQNEGSPIWSHDP